MAPSDFLPNDSLRSAFFSTTTPRRFFLSKPIKALLPIVPPACPRSSVPGGVKTPSSIQGMAVLPHSGEPFRWRITCIFSINGASPVGVRPRLAERYLQIVGG